jgi:lincosamide nucleotidyltransferase A/C/D/E
MWNPGQNYFSDYPTYQGGWGVDALLGKQTRSHKDLDIATPEKHVALLRDVLSARGFREVRLEDARPWNFVLGDRTGREIDVHVIGR